MAKKKSRSAKSSKAGKAAKATRRSGPAAGAVWSGGTGAGLQGRADAELCISYCAGRDVVARPMADAVLVPHDLQTNRAHCAMLCKTGIINATRLREIERGLARIEKDWEAGRFRLKPTLEDVHMNVERAVARHSGEAAAGVMHTGRSRNDQCATDIRLWLRDRLIEAVEQTAGTVSSLARLASTHRRTVMAGWTHGQPAMPTTLGHWAAAHGYALARDLRALAGLWPRINECPLGAAAGFGTSWPIDRRMTARWLGFDAPQASSLDCVSTRWEAEARLGSVLAILMTHLSSLGQDLYYLSSPPRRLVRLDASFTTGSSIMPQKRNPDFAEVTRARAAAVQSLVVSITASGRGALSGYNRDSQWTKYWIMDLVDEVGPAPLVFARALATMQVDKKALAETARRDFVSAVDLADTVASTRGVEFRRLYHLVHKAVVQDAESGVFELETVNALLEKEGIRPPLTAAEFNCIKNPKLAVEGRRSLGSPAPDEVAVQAAELRSAAAQAARWALAKRRSLDRARDQLRKAIRKLTNR